MVRPCHPSRPLQGQGSGEQFAWVRALLWVMTRISHHLLAATLLLAAGAVQLAACGTTAPEEAVGSDNRTAPTAAPVTATGTWSVLEIDGSPVEPDSFRVQLRAGEVTGGKDGCNNWGYVEGSRRMPDGSRMIESEAQFCPETPQSRAYRSVVVKPELTAVGSDRLLLTGGGHRLLVERCEWQTVREERPGSSSEMRRCQTEKPRSG
jgi:hypothetical protein